MRPKIKFPIRLKLLLAMSFLVVVSIIAYLTLAIKLFRDDKTTLVFDLNANVVRTVGSEFRSDLERQSTDLRLLAQGSQNADWTRVLLGSNSDLLAFRMYDSKGEETNAIDRANSYLEEKQIISTEWNTALTAALENFKAARFSKDVWDRRTPWVDSSFPAKDAPVIYYGEEVRFEGVAEPRIVLGIIRADRWWSTLRNQGVVTPFLVDGKGRLLLSTDPEELKKRETYREHPLVIDAVGSPVALVLRSFHWLGRDYLGAYSDLGKAGIKVVSMVPEDEIFRAAMRLMSKSLLFGLLVITIALWVSFRLASSLTRPISELVAATENISKGRFENSFSVRSEDEVGELSRSFQSMSISLERLQKQLVESERHAAIGQVARGVGHEFGNILMRVFGKIDLAMMDTEEPKTKAHLETALQAMDRAKAILQNLRSYSKTSEGGTKQVREQLVLSTVFDQTLTLIAHELKIGNIEVIRDYPSVPLALSASAPELGQVFLNLLINAKQAMPNGGKLRVRICDTAKEGLEGAEITVRDSGSGIPSEILPRIFETAFSTKGDEGSGLGLAISKSIIEDHGGTILAESPDDGGALFRIWLPKGKNS